MFKARTCLVSEVRAKCDCNGDAAGTHGNRESQRIKRMLQGVFESVRSLFSRRRSNLLIEQTPARRCYDQPARNLDDREGNAEKR